MTTRSEEMEKMDKAALIAMIGTLEEQLGKWYALHRAERGELLRHLNHGQVASAVLRIEREAQGLWDAEKVREERRTRIVAFVQKCAEWAFDDQDREIGREARALWTEENPEEENGA